MDIVRAWDYIVELASLLVDCWRAVESKRCKNYGNSAKHHPEKPGDVIYEKAHKRVVKKGQQSAPGLLTGSSFQDFS